MTVIFDVSSTIGAGTERTAVRCVAQLCRLGNCRHHAILFNSGTHRVQCMDMIASSVGFKHHIRVVVNGYALCIPMTVEGAFEDLIAVLLSGP